MRVGFSAANPRLRKDRTVIVEHRSREAGAEDEDLVKRLEPDDVAIIDHADLDRVSAEELAESGVRVVVNVAASLSGRFRIPGRSSSCGPASS